MTAAGFSARVPGGLSTSCRGLCLLALAYEVPLMFATFQESKRDGHRWPASALSAQRFVTSHQTQRGAIRSCENSTVLVFCCAHNSTFLKLFILVLHIDKCQEVLGFRLWRRLHPSITGPLLLMAAHWQDWFLWWHGHLIMAEMWFSLAQQNTLIELCIAPLRGTKRTSKHFFNHPI